MKLKFFSLVAAIALVLAIGSVAKADTVGGLTLTGCPGGGCPDATYSFDITNTSATLTITITGGVVGTNNEITSVNLGFGTGTTSYTNLAVSLTDNNGDTNVAWTPLVGPISNGDCKNITGTFVCANGTVDINNSWSGTWTWTWDNSVTIATDPTAVHIGTNYGPHSGLIVSQTGEPVPEPGSLMLFGTGLLGLAGVLRRKLMS